MPNQYKRLLGARHVVDPRAKGYLLAPRLVEAPTPPDAREYKLGPILDQNTHPNSKGHLGTCVGHGWTAWRNAEPVMPTSPFDSSYAITVYDYAQGVDEWSDTPPEEGTSVQAGAKAMVRDGALKEGYLWARNLSELITWLGNYGTAVIGSLWMDGMFYPDGKGFVWPTGGIAGGHCYHVYGYEGFTGFSLEALKKVKLEFQQSWGDWGLDGRFYMTGEAWMALTARGDWSICTPAELAPAPPPEPSPPEPTPTPLTKMTKTSFCATRVDKLKDKHLELTSGGKKLGEFKGVNAN